MSYQQNKDIIEAYFDKYEKVAKINPILAMQTGLR